jgi:type I restriction enzyme S subunit
VTAVPAMKNNANGADLCRVPLGDVVDFIRGVGFDKSDVRYEAGYGYIPILRAGNIAEELDCGNDLVWVPERLVAVEQFLQEGDLAICMSSGSAAVVGKTAQLREPWHGSVGAFCGIVRPRTGLSADFLAHWFRGDDFRSWRDGQARGANIQNLRFSELAKLQIPRPPLPEQTRVAADLTQVLSAVGAARRAAEDRLAAAEALPSAYIRAVFESDEARLWARVTVERLRQTGVLAGHQDGNHGELHPRNRDFVEAGVRFVTARHIARNGRLELGNAPFVSKEQASGLRIGFAEADDVLLAHNATVGPVAIAPAGCDPFVVGTSLTIYRANANALDPHFLARALQADDFQRQLLDAMKQTTRNQVPITRQRELVLPLPPVAQQRSIATDLSRRLEATEALIVRCREELEAIEALPTTVLRAAFRGP